MSYILDALKKAESERKLGSVPSVYMEPLPLARSDEPVSGMRRSWIWIAVLAFAAAAIAAVWMMLGSKEEPASAPAVALQASGAAPAAPPSPPAAHVEQAVPAKPLPAKSPPKKEEASRPPKRTASAPVRAKPVAPPHVTAHAGGNEAPSTSARGDVRNKAKAGDAAQPALANTPSTQPAAPVAQVPALRELPEHIQRGMPAVSIGGYIYSTNPADRSLLLNNRLIREGEQAGSGLILEKMSPKEAIFNYQGQRFRVPY